MAMNNDIAPKDRILVRAADAADLLSMGYSDFCERARNGEIPVAAYSGQRRLYSVGELRRYFAGQGQGAHQQVDS